MSAGNLRNASQKANNFTYQFKVLQLLGAISGSSGSGATEATAQQILQAIQAGQDFESRIVIDDGGNGDAYIEVRIWNPDTQTWEDPLYYAPGSNTGVPAGSLTAPIVYQNNTQVLADIYAELLDQGLSLDTLSTPTAGVATSMTRVTSAGPASVAAGKRRVSFANMGIADSTVDGATLKKGEVVTFSADGLRDTLEEITYDALTSELLITTVG